MRGVLERLLGVVTARRHQLARRLPPPAPSARAVRRHAILTLAGLLPVLAAAGFFVVILGLIPIKASPGHWAVTEWFLQFAKRRAVVMQSMAIDVPPLEDQGMVLKGAGHYAGGCAPCHGAPGVPRPAVPMQMTPEPPDLSIRARAWNPDELFHIVKHGIKFTGMPAWPAKRRDDEVWAVVAFLVALPELTPAAYRRLVHGEGEAASQAAQVRSPAPPGDAPAGVNDRCGRCHGHDGNGRGAGVFPRLAGQRTAYLRASLEAFSNGHRVSGIMLPIASSLTDASRREMAEYYAGLAPRPVDGTDDAAAVVRGERIAQQGIPEQRVPSCRDCHGASDPPRNPAYPVLDGQYARYLALQLRLFKRHERGGSPYADIMHEFADRLSEAQIADVTRYYASRGVDGGGARVSGKDTAQPAQ